MNRSKKLLSLVLIFIFLIPVSRFGSLAESASSGPFVYTLFLPALARDNSSLTASSESFALAAASSNTSLTVGGVPNGIALDPANGNLYVANFGPGTLSVINGSTNSVTSTIDLNYQVSPWDVGYNPFNGNMYVSETKNGAVSVISPANNTLVATVAVGDDMLSGDHDDRPIGVAFNPYNDYMYVAMYGSGYLAEIDSEKNVLVANAPIGLNAFVNTGLWGLAFDPANCNFYASNEVENTLTVVNGASNSLVSTISTGRSPDGVAVDTDPGPDFGEVVVANYAANTVSVINDSSNAIVDTIKVGQNPDGIAFDPVSADFYVANYGDGTVSVISGVTYAVSNTINVGSGASGVVYDPLNGEVYVTDSNIGAVSIISTDDQLTPSTSNQDYSAENCHAGTPVLSNFTSSSSLTGTSTTLNSTSLSSSIFTQTDTSSSPSHDSNSSNTSLSAQSSYSTSGSPVQNRGDSLHPDLILVAVVLVVIAVSLFALRFRAKKTS